MSLFEPRNDHLSSCPCPSCLLDSADTVFPALHVTVVGRGDGGDAGSLRPALLPLAVCWGWRGLRQAVMLAPRGRDYGSSLALLFPHSAPWGCIQLCHE